MDDSTKKRHNRHMRRRITLIGLGVTSIAYVGVVARNLDLVTQSPSFLAWTLVIVPIMVGCGAVVMWRRSENPLGPLLTLAGLALFVVPTILEIPTIATFETVGSRDWMWAPIVAVLLLDGVGMVVSCDLVVRLPDGRYRSDRDRRLIRAAWLTLLAPGLLMITSTSAPSHSQAFPGLEAIANPLAVEPLTRFEGVARSLWSLSYTIFAVALYLQYMRYRSASQRERKQVRWVLFAALISIAVGLVPFALESIGLIEPQGHGSLAAIVSTLIISVFPISIVVAVLEPRWIDVDIVIRKSMVYGVISFGILLLYAATAATLGVAAGQRLDLEIAVVLTVLIAAAFHPVQRRLQALADRWVFGDRPTRYEAVTTFRENIDRSTDARDLLHELTVTIRQALRLTWVEAVSAEGDVIASGEASGEPVFETEIGTTDERLGILRCGVKQRGRFDTEDEALVRTLAGHAGLALANHRLAGRIVTAAEAERRRIERNIHDGAQQELVALVARLGLARDSAELGELSEAEIAGLQRDARTILTDLRALAQGIHPSVLSDGGIVAAIEARCTHVPLRISIQADGLRRRRFDDDIEGAAYFFVSECLANALKHADATAVSVSLGCEGSALHVTVADDGCGFETGAAHRNGLTGLADRMHALGGSLNVSSGAGGSRIEATLPTRSP